MVTKNLRLVEEKICQACERSGRKREEVTLIAVSKTKPIEMMEEAMTAGIRVFGENKVQEILKKEVSLPKDIDWHLIGHLQRNKVRQIAGKTARIHSVDSLRLAEEIQKEYEKIQQTAKILIEVNVARGNHPRDRSYAKHPRLWSYDHRSLCRKPRRKQGSFSEFTEITS